MDSLQMDSQQTFSRLLEELDYASSPNLISRDTPSESIPAELEVTWREAKDKLGIDAVYFVANAPVIYFKRFESFDREKIAEEATVQEVQCPTCGSVSKAKLKGQSMVIAPHPPRKSRPVRNVARWMQQGVEWVFVQKKEKL